jgi:hypothetical protein
MAGKYHEGSLVDGSVGSDSPKSVGTYEHMGVHGGEGGKLSIESGATSSIYGHEEAGFSLAGAGYRGPENMTPTNMGTRNPDDVTKSTV